MFSYRIWMGVLLSVACLAGCGGVPGVSQSQATGLLEDAGRAIVNQDWAALAALCASSSGATAESVAGQIGGFAATVGTLTDVTSTSIEEANDAVKSELINNGQIAVSKDAIRCLGSIVVGNGPAANSPAFEAIRVDTVIGEEGGAYKILTILNVVVVD